MEPGRNPTVIRTPDQRLRVFVSSTLEELAAERAAAQKAIAELRLVPVLFELGARPHPPRDLYRAYLDQSHVFVGLYWQRYGWVAPDMEISGLEDEWRLATHLPRLVYIKHPAPDREPALTALLSRIRDDNITSYRRFETADELNDLLKNDLAVLLSERFEVASSATTVPVALGHARLDDSLPRPPSPLIGRDDDLRMLRNLISRHDVRLVTITGPGGSGKTRLAVELADQLRGELGYPVCFVDLTGLRSTTLVLPTLAAAVGVHDAGERPLLDAVASVLRDQSVLLVIDNMEHVIEAAAELGDLLSVTRDVKMLVTSRQPLHLRWEQEYALLPLAVPDPTQQESLDAIASTPAVELFVDRARRMRPGFTLDTGNVGAVAEITRRLDGLPLALELAAARLRVLSPADLLARLEHRLDTLASSSPDMPGRHRTLRAAITWSHELLSADEQVLFRRLGVFAGGGSLEAIEAICTGDDLEPTTVLDLVSSLVDKSLVVSAADIGMGQTRFFLLETTREFAIEQLLAAGEADRICDRHLGWHAKLAAQAWGRFWSADMAPWLEVLEREHDNLRTALDHAQGGGDPMLGLQIGAALWPFWDVRGHYREGEARLRRLLERAPADGSATRGRALSALGWLVALLGDFEQALALMEQGLPMVREHGTPQQLAWSLAELGNVAFSLGLSERAELVFDESLRLARELGEVFLMGMGLFGLAYVALLNGDLDLMQQRLRESLELTRFCIQPWGIAWAQFSLGVVSIMLGETHAAVPAITESLELRWSIRDARGIAESLQVLATLASTHGEMEWSARLHGAAELQREANGLTILPFLRPLHDESEARLGAALDDAQLRRLWQQGRATPLEKVVAEALGRERKPSSEGS